MHRETSGWSISFFHCQLPRYLTVDSLNRPMTSMNKTQIVLQKVENFENYRYVMSNELPAYEWSLNLCRKFDFRRTNLNSLSKNEPTLEGRWNVAFICLSVCLSPFDLVEPPCAFFGKRLQ